MNKIISPALIAAGIAGGGIGTGVGFLSEGERLEKQGATGWEQFTGSIGDGIVGGLGGTAIGVGSASTVMALKKILGKQA